MASVSISNISSGMTLARSFVAYGHFDSTVYYAIPTAIVQCSFTIGGTTYSPADYQQEFDSTGQYGWWQAGFESVATGQHGVLTASLQVPNPPPPAEATDLTVSENALSVQLVIAGGGNPAAAPAPAKGKPAGPVVAGKVKSPFEVEGVYTPGPSDIVIAYMRKRGRPRGSSENHTLIPHARKWKARVRKRFGEVGTGYAVIAELQHNGVIKATAAILNVELEP